MEEVKSKLGKLWNTKSKGKKKDGDSSRRFLLHSKSLSSANNSFGVSSSSRFPVGVGVGVGVGVIAPAAADVVVNAFTFSELSSMTDGFNRNRLLGPFESGLLYRGIISSTTEDQQHIIVKTWNLIDDKKDDADSKDSRHQALRQLKTEIDFLTNPDMDHPSLPKILGCCRTYNMVGVVYSVRPLDTLENMHHKECFRWVDRLHIALRLALLLRYLHGFDPCFLIRNLCAAHVVLDLDKNPVLCDFGMLVHGEFYQESGAVHRDPVVVQSGIWSKDVDVFSYGTILLGLLSDSGLENKSKNIDGSTWHSYKGCTGDFRWCRSSFRLSDEKFRSHKYYHSCDDHKVTKLAIRCIDTLEGERPKMGEVSLCMQSLYLFSINERGLLPIGGVSITEFTYEDLRDITEEFGEENLIGKFQFGTIYKGKIRDGFKNLQTQEVVVKIWEISNLLTKDNKYRLKDEIAFLRHSRSITFPCLPRVIGVCCQNMNFGVVYQLKTIGTLQSFMLKESFHWAHRVKVVNKLIGLLLALHSYDPPYTIGNISSDHVLLDEDFNPILIDYGMMTGGVLGAKKVSKYQRIAGARRYIDEFARFYGVWGPSVDIYALGVLLVELFCSRDQEFDVQKFTEDESKISSVLVDEKLRIHAFYSDDDTLKILKIALQCVRNKQRWTIANICHGLESLKFYNPLSGNYIMANIGLEDDNCSLREDGEADASSSSVTILTS